MTNIGFEAGVVLLLLLPGFISARIIQLFCPKSKKSEFEWVTDALIHTFIVVVLYSICVRGLPLHLNTWVEDKTTRYDVDVLRLRLLLLLGLAVLWGSVVTVCKNRDFPWKWLRDWGATQQSAEIQFGTTYSMSMVNMVTFRWN